jgi:hypothetical protein
VTINEVVDEELVNAVQIDPAAPPQVGFFVSGETQVYSMFGVDGEVTVTATPDAVQLPGVALDIDIEVVDIDGDVVDEDAAGDASATVTFSSTAADQFYFRVISFTGDEGGFTIDVSVG